MEELVTITKAEYDSLIEDRQWLECLEATGLDNWEGTSYAHDYYREEYGKGLYD